MTTPDTTTESASAVGHNFDLSAAEKSDLAKLTREIVQIETKVKALNADKNAKRKAIKAMRLDLDAWRASKRRQEMDPDDRAEFDRSQAICNQVFGIPLQGDMFGGDAESNAKGVIPAGALN